MKIIKIIGIKIQLMEVIKYLTIVSVWGINDAQSLKI